MTPILWIVLVISLLACAIIVEARLKRKKRSRPLHEKFGVGSAKKPLGMEATDVEGFERSNILNGSLARPNGAKIPHNKGLKITAKDKD